MKITWLGHACFKIEKNGYSVILDPYTDGSVPGLKPIRETANMVICSHEHGDHSGRACVEIAAASECPFTITTIDTYHDEKEGSMRGKNKITIIDDGESKIAHMGDLGCELELDQLKQLNGLDVMMVPVGGYYTIDAVQAARLVEQIRPAMTIPMHYRSDDKRTAEFGYAEISEVNDFLENMDSVKTLNSSEVDSKDALAQVVVLQPYNI